MPTQTLSSISAAAKRLEMDFGRLMDSLPGLVWTASPDGRAEYVGKGWLDYTGLSFDDAVGVGWTAALHPEDAPRVLAEWAAIIASGKLGEVEARLRRSDGAYRWFLFRACPMPEPSGEVVRWCGMNVDIDDRLRAEAAAREHQRRYQQVVDGLPGTVALFTPDGRITFCNRQMLEYIGETLGHVQATLSAYPFHPDDRNDATARWDAGIESEKPFDIEARLRRADGVYRWHWTGVFPLRNAAGEIELWYGLSTDIDDTRRAQAQLAVEKSLLESVALGVPLKNVLDALCREVENLSPGSHCNILLVDLAQNRFHVGAEGSLPTTYCATKEGKTIDPSYGPCSRAATLKTHFIASDLSVDSRWSPGWIALMAEHGLRSCWSMPILSRSLQVFGVFAVYRLEAVGPTSSEQELIDRFTKIAGIAIERRQAEDALKASEAELRSAYGRLTEAQRLSKTGSFTWDVAADEHNWSEEIYRIFDFKAGAKVTMAMITEAIHPDDMSAVEASIAHAVQGGDLDLVFRIVAPAGVKYAHVMGHPIEHITDRRVFIGALQDVTESKTAEEALNRARAELAHVARAATLSALTASIAHEVNQPLAGIMTNANTCLRMLAADPPDVEGAKATAQRTIRDGNRASEVIHRLRAMFARKQPATEAVDLNDAAREVLALSASELQGARVIVRTDFADGLPALYGDRVQLQQVILNLLLNAADALRDVHERPRRLDVSTTRAASGEVTLSVRDEGVGIEPESLKRLFDPFYSTKSEGMGIGLSISRSIIQAHDGHLWATPNQSGPGVTFTFSLPFEANRASGAACNAAMRSC